MLVHFVTDEPTKIPAFRAMLEPKYLVVPKLLGGGDTLISPSGVLMVDADLRKELRVEQVKRVLRELNGVDEKLFVVQQHLRSMIAQAYALGATAVVSRPKEIVAKLEEIKIAVKAARGDLGEGCPEITESAESFAFMFAADQASKVTYREAERATTQVINSIERDGLTAWLDDVRRYHQGTFQHCLLVTGIATGFALEIGFNSADVKRLGMAATLHDIGKSHIPVPILDKPGRLDPAEETIMRRHPEIGYELLKDVPGISTEILDGVRHHHEYLDGSGYPDGLSGSEISDLVRLLTISDIFAALIEARSYKPVKSRQEAYKILCDMGGKLEEPLIKAFRKVALVA